MDEYREDMNDYSENMNTPEKKRIYSSSIRSDEDVDFIALKKHMALEKMPQKISMVIFSVMVELVSMMRSQSAVHDFNKPTVSVYFGEDPTLYYLRCETIVMTGNAETLVKYINRFNKHDKDELRRYFKYVRKASSADGLGLELIEIAKRATAPIGYSVSEQEEGSSLFSILVRIKKRGKLV